MPHYAPFVRHPPMIDADLQFTGEPKIGVDL
jgi:hypothetical protein